VLEPLATRTFCCFVLCLFRYQKKKKASKAQRGFEGLVTELQQAVTDKGGALGVFKAMDASGSGMIDQLAFRGGLQVCASSSGKAPLAQSFPRAWCCRLPPASIFLPIFKVLCVSLPPQVSIAIFHSLSSSAPLLSYFCYMRAGPRHQGGGGGREQGVGLHGLGPQRDNLLRRLQ